MANNLLGQVFNKKNSYILIIIAVAIIAIIVINASLPQGGFNFVNNLIPSSKTQEKPSTTAPVSTTPSTTPSLTYDEALKTYANQRIQFGFNASGYCAATPSNISLKIGTKIMLDNRSNRQLAIGLDDIIYNVKAYDFKIVTLTTPQALPHTIRVDCGTGRNNASIILQK